MMWYWESHKLGPSKSGFGTEYLFIAKNAAGVMVKRIVTHEPDLVDDDDMVWTIRTFLKGMLQEIEGLRA